MERYSHRNGETDLPTIEGAFGFRGIRKQYRTARIDNKWFSFLEREIPFRDLIPSVDPDRREVYFAGDEVRDSLNNYIGQWWGPITGPWEDEE